MAVIRGAAPRGSSVLSLAYSIADQSFARTKSLGILNLSVQLAEALASRSEFTRFEVFSNSTLRDQHGKLAGRQVRTFDRACATSMGRIWWDQVSVYSEAARQNVEWLLLPKGFASFCRKPRVKVAAYVHDVIGEHYRQHYPGLWSKPEAWYFRRSLLATLSHAALIFTNSDFTRRELVALSAKHAIRPPAIVVAGIGFDPVPAGPRSRRSDIVVLASPLPHKRTAQALRSMAGWHHATDFTGRIHWVGRFPEGLQRPAYSNWQYHERLDEPAYRGLLNASRAVVYFSEYEGFGMPPVEAVLNRACPVYSAIASTREVMDGAGAPFDNESFESFAAAMQKALVMEPAELDRAAQALLARHNWPAVADRIILALTGQRAGTPG